MGTEITYHSFTRELIPSAEAHEVVDDLKDQIRSRPDPLDRSEPWEGYEVVRGAFENAPHLDAFVYSFAKQMRILASRMTLDEKKELGWTV
jgi:hypothetical protein